MKAFSKWINESVATTRRQSMLHLQKMKPLEFIDLMISIDREMNGKLKNIKTVMKVDGLGARFGRDSNGRIFFEGSRTGPIFNDNAFSEYAINKGSSDEIIVRARHYDDLLQVFKGGAFMSAVPNDRKVVCEIFYNPMAHQDGEGIQFVTVRYDKSKLGSLMSILPYRVEIASNGQPAPDQSQILQALYSKSSSKIKVIDPSLKMEEIDIQGFIDPIKNLDKDARRIIQSRKRDDLQKKQNIMQVIQATKDRLAEYLLKHENILGKFKLGPEIEGIVLHLRGREYKVTTPEFKKALAAKRAG